MFARRELSSVGDAGKEVELENVSSDIAGYLARMDLFKACGIEYKENYTRHDRQTDLVEICVADKVAEGGLLANKIVTALVGATPGYDPHAAPDEMTHRKTWAREELSLILENIALSDPGFISGSLQINTQLEPCHD